MLIVVPGYAATLLVMLFFAALNLFGLGIVGSYAWRAYENTRSKGPNSWCSTSSGVQRHT